MEPEEYEDEYHLALEKMIQEKIQHPDYHPKVTGAKKRSTNVIDLVSVLQESLKVKTKKKPGKSKPKAA